MIPLNLQVGLKKRMEEHFEHFLLKSPNGNQVPLNIFEQHLPEKPGNDVSHYPYTLIRLAEGSSEEEDSSQIVKVLFIVGTFDEAGDNQGYKDAVTVVSKIYENITRNPVIDNCFELNFPVKWAYADEDTEPFYFCGLETNWIVPTVQREDVEAMI